ENVMNLIKYAFMIIVSFAAMVFSVEYLIPSAKSLALDFGVSETIIGITLLAVGTSLPELMVAISSAKKGMGDLLLGTIIGSNISNILLVGGLSAIIYPIKVRAETLLYYIPFSILLTIIMLAFIREKWELRRMQGIALLSLYIIFILTLYFWMD
ncbi:MAG: sodium:calcium antiporter, partial [Nanoarchaeota archaeon]